MKIYSRLALWLNLVAALTYATPALAKPSFSIADASCTLGLHCVFTVTRTGLATSYSDIPFATKGAAGQSVSVTLRFLKADTVKTVAVGSVAPGQFTATIKILRYGNIGRGTAVGTVIGPAPAPVPSPSPCPTGHVLVNGSCTSAPPAPTPAPTPAPAPMPMPMPASGYVLAPSLDGLPAIASPFDYNLALQAIPATPTHVCANDGSVRGNNQPCSAAPDYVGAFRFITFDSGVNSDDPVMGLCGNSHLHQYFGRAGWKCGSTYESMRLSAGTPGNLFNGQLPGNGSGYWSPAMLDANGNVVKPAFVSDYYKRRPASDPKCGGLGTVFGAEGKCVGLPNGLRMIVGWNAVTGLRTGRTWFNCQNGPVVKTAVPGAYPDLDTALANCPDGNLVGEVIEFPDCWDGKNLDSPDHRSHMADMTRDPQSGQLSCDSAHPYVIPKLTLGQWYPSSRGMHLSSDPMAPGKAAGYTAHADYFEGWDPTIKGMWIENCINKMLNCSAGDLGNGYRIKGAAI